MSERTMQLLWKWLPIIRAAALFTNCDVSARARGWWWCGGGGGDGDCMAMARLGPTLIRTYNAAVAAVVHGVVGQMHHLRNWRQGGDEGGREMTVEVLVCR